MHQAAKSTILILKNSTWMLLGRIRWIGPAARCIMIKMWIKYWANSFKKLIDRANRDLLDAILKVGIEFQIVTYLAKSAIHTSQTTIFWISTKIQILPTLKETTASTTCTKTSTNPFLQKIIWAKSIPLSAHQGRLHGKNQIKFCIGGIFRLTFSVKNNHLWRKFIV